MLFEIESDELFLLRKDLLMDLRVRKHQDEDPARFLPFVERVVRVVERYWVERKMLAALKKDWIRQAQLGGLGLQRSVYSVKVPRHLDTAEVRALVAAYANDLGYGSVMDMMRARLLEPAMEWHRRKNAALEEVRKDLQDVQDIEVSP